MHCTCCFLSLSGIGKNRESFSVEFSLLKGLLSIVSAPPVPLIFFEDTSFDSVCFPLLKSSSFMVYSVLMSGGPDGVGVVVMSRLSS